MTKPRFALIGCEANRAGGYAAAARRLGLTPASLAPDPAAGALAGVSAAVVGPGCPDPIRMATAIAELGAPVLLTPAAARGVYPSQVACLSHLRFSAGAARLKAVLDRGALGRITGFDLRYGRPPGREADSAPYWTRGAGVGVLSDPGADLLDLLGWWLGPLSVVDSRHDGRGGLEAEAEAVLNAGGAEGQLSLSRLRTLRNTVVIRGEAGSAELDLATFALLTDPGGAPEPASHRPASDAALRTLALQALLADDAERLRPSGLDRSLAELHERGRPLSAPWDARPEPPQSRLAGRSVLVLGASGFIGARLVEKLATEESARVTAGVRRFRRAARIARFDVGLAEADLGADLGDLARGHDVVFNLAHDFAGSSGENLDGFRRLVAACVDAGVERFVHVSSIAVYDDWPQGDLTEASPSSGPGHEYKEAKAEMDAELVRRSTAGELAAVILQPTIVYGPFSAQWTDRPADWLLHGGLALPEGAGLCNAVYVDDVVEALILAAVAPGAAGERFIISGPAPEPWRDLFQGYAAALGRPEAVTSFPVPAEGPARPPSLAGRMRVLLGDPGRLAAWGPARRAVKALSALAGADAVDRLKQRVLGIGRSSGPVVHHPSASELKLYLSTGRAGIEKAQARLGWRPRIGLQAGLERTGAYLRWRYRAD